MVALTMILKAYRLKKATDRLMKAKENALRIHRGERPRYPWYEECWSWLVQCFKKYFCMAFCPCCFPSKKKKQEERSYSQSFLRRPCLDGTFENYTIKSFLGFMFGLLLTLGTFFFLLNQLNVNPRATTLICCCLGLFLTIGLAFSSEIRCIIFLILPEFFSSRGRVALLAYVYILVMSGPTKNAMRNTNILVESMNCGQEVISKQTKAILKSIFAPLIAIVDTMRDILKALKDFSRMMKQAFIAIRDLLLEIISAIKNMFGWLQSITKICSSKYGSPYERCNKAFDDAIDDCNKKLGFFKFLCYIVSAVKYICEIARIVDLLCMIPKAVKTGIIEPLKEQVKTFARHMYNQFYVNITFVHFYNFSLEQSKTFEEIRGDIAAEVRERSRWFTNLVDLSDLAMAFVLFNLVFRAYMYRLRYLTADHFDNFYISHEIRELDDRRFAMDKETILPLSSREKLKYVDTFSVRMVRTERKKLGVAGSLLLVSGIQMGFYMLLDYSLYSFLKMIRFHGKVQTKASVPAQMQMHVSGEGVMADMYRQMITSFDPVMGSVPDFDTTECLPNPIPIDVDRYQQIAIIYLLCFLLAVIQSYGLRLRHVVCSCYYPHREKLRAVWLYNHILRTRGGISKFLRRKIRRNVYGDVTIDDVSFVDRLSAQSKIFGRLAKAFGYVRVYCLCCNEPGKPDDYENFKRCGTPGCKGIYCNTCFKDINNFCTICTKPVDYGDLSDISEERDSSEEERPQRFLKIVDISEESGEDTDTENDGSGGDESSDDSDGHDDEKDEDSCETDREEKDKDDDRDSGEDGDYDSYEDSSTQSDSSKSEDKDYGYQYEERQRSSPDEAELEPKRSFRDLEAGKGFVLSRVQDYEEDAESEDNSQSFAEHLAKRQRAYSNIWT